MDYTTWHQDNYHNSTGACLLYGDHCTVSIREAAHAEALFVENHIR